MFPWWGKTPFDMTEKEIEQSCKFGEAIDARNDADNKEFDDLYDAGAKWRRRSQRGDVIESNIRQMLKHPGVYNPNDAHHFAYSASQNEIAFFHDNGDLTFDIITRQPLTVNGISYAKEIARSYTTDRNRSYIDSSVEALEDSLRSGSLDNGVPAQDGTAEGGNGGLGMANEGNEPGADSAKGVGTGEGVNRGGANFRISHLYTGNAADYANRDANGNIRIDHKWRDGKAMFRRAQSQAVTPEDDAAYKEYMETVKRPDANERTMRLAPNGKRSNLTNALYHLVRTKRFKDWFGDWEKQAVAKAIIDEDEIVSSVSLIGMKSKEQRAKAKELYDALKNGEPVETLDGRMVRFTGVGFKEMKSHSSDPHTLAIIPILREVISTAHYIEEGDRRIESGNELRFHVYARRVNLGDESMIARIVLREDVNGNVFYDGESTSLENIREIQNPVFRKPIATQRLESPYASHSLAKFFDEVNREAAGVSRWWIAKLNAHRVWSSSLTIGRQSRRDI